jgi:hypothetical protein
VSHSHILNVEALPLHDLTHLVVNLQTACTLQIFWDQYKDKE